MLTEEYLQVTNAIMSYICDLVLLNYRSKYCALIYPFVSNELRTRSFLARTINIIHRSILVYKKSSNIDIYPLTLE